MAKNNNLTDFLTDIAKQIRTNDGTSDKIDPQTFSTKISNTVGENVAKKSSTDLTVSGATVTAPAGYYASAASKSVTTVSRASTTISTTTDTAKITYTAHNNQGTGYVTGSDQTASKTITLTAADDVVTASDGTSSVSLSVGSSSVSVSDSALAVTPTAIASATGNISLTSASSQPSSGYYIKAHGGNSATNGESSTVTWTKGYTDASTSSTQKSISSNAVANSTDQYYTIPTASVSTTSGSVDSTNKTYTQGKVKVESDGYIASGDKVSGATFANSATSGVTYLDISATSAAPVLVSDSYLFINKGYTDNVKISLARLVPDSASGADSIKAGMLDSVSAYDNDGKLVTGNIATKTDSGNVTLNATTTSKSYAAGYYPNAHGATHSLGTITNNTSGGTSTDTITAGKQIKIGAGYYGTDTYYTAQSYTYMTNTAGVIDVTDLTVTPNALSGSWNSSTSKYVVSQASTTGTMQSTVTTAGYVSSTVGTKNTGTVTVSAPTNLEIAMTAHTVSTSTNSGASRQTVTPLFGTTQYVNVSAGYDPKSYDTVAKAVTDVSALATMDSNLVSGNAGKIYRYTGTTGTSSGGNYYVQNSLYVYEG